MMKIKKDNTTNLVMMPLLKEQVELEDMVALTLKTLISQIYLTASLVIVLVSELVQEVQEIKQLAVVIN